VLIENLDCVDLPTSVLSCHDMSCCNSGHYDALNEYMAAITNACANACMKAVPRTSSQSLSVSERNEGLSEIEIVDNVEPYSDDDVPVHKKQRKMS